MLQANFYFALGITASFGLGLLTSVISKKFIIQKMFPNFTEKYLFENRNVYYGAISAMFTTYAYFKLNTMYVNELCLPFIEKYTE